MASAIRNIEFIEKHYDKHAKFVLNKIVESNISLSRKSTNYVAKLVHPIVNYIDFVNNQSTNGMETLSIDDIVERYNMWCHKQKQKFPQINYDEKNTILLDYRKNNIGYYWVDLKSYYSSEMIFRMNNCGRVNSYQNMLELREFHIDDCNYSRVVVVIDNNGYINQIRGFENIKPDIMYKDYIYDLFLNYDKLKGFRFLFTKETDFTHMDLDKNQLLNLRTVRPELFKLL